MPTYRKPGNLAYRVIGGRAYVVNPRESELHEFNETGTFIWKLLDEKQMTGAKLAEKLAGEYDVSAARAREDVKEFLAFLEKSGLAEKHR
jgi:hypothetical protein